MRRIGLLAAGGAAFLSLGAQSAVRPLPLVLGGDPSVRVQWSQVIATANDDWINDLVALANGKVLASGFVNRADGSFASDWQAIAVELSPDGGIMSDRRYGANGGTDALWSSAERADGNRIFAGFTTRIGPGGINGYVLLTRPDGTIVKENGFGHAGYDRFTDLAPAGDGYVFVGHSQLPDNGARRRTYIVKTDANALPQWERIYGGAETWSALYIEPAGDGGFIIAGGTDGAGDGDMFVQKVDGEGRELWRKRVGTPDWDEINHGLAIRPDGRIVLVGYTHPRGGEVNDLVAATLTALGEVERLERFGGTGDERAIGLKRAGDRVWIVGQTSSAGAGGSDLLVASLGADGGFDGGALTLGGTADDNGTAIHPLPGGGLLIAGYSRNLGVGAQDAFIARVTRPALSKPHPAFRRTVVTPAR